VFVPLHVIAASARVAFEVVLERGRVVRVLRGFDADTLRGWGRGRDFSGHGGYQGGFQIHA
jgi:hypothetical protein